MDIYHTDGWNIRRDPDVITQLLQEMQDEPAISQWITELAYQPQEYSHGGAIHFTGRRRSQGRAAFIKVGAFAEEVQWTQVVARSTPSLTPELLGSGMHLGKRTLGWIGSEFMPHGTLGSAWAGQEFLLLMDAAAAFQAMATTVELPVRELDETHLRNLFGHAMDLGAPGPARALVDRLHQDWDWLCERCPSSICHGDLHLANALSRQPPPHGPVVLIDFQPTRQPWPLEAAYCQSLQLSRPGRSGSQNLVEVLRQARQRHGFIDGPQSQVDRMRIERLSLGWMALRMWQNPGVDRQDPMFAAGVAASITQALA